MTSRSAIVFAADQKLFPVAAYQVARLRSLGVPDQVDIIIATESAEDVKLASDFGIPFRPLTLDASMTSSMQLGGWAHYSAAAYYRILLPGLLANEYQRLLYLDVDIYIHSDRIFRLLEMPMNGYAIAATRDLLPFRPDSRNLEELSYTTTNKQRKYLNSGMLLIDPRRFEEESLREKLLSTNQKKRLWLVDQSAFNIVLDGDWLELSPSFNMLVELWASFVREVFEPTVVHFIGPDKPWSGPRFRYDHPVKAALEAFIQASPWKNFLATFYGFKDAWADLQNAAGRIPTGPRAPPLAWLPFVNHLRSTPFADVTLGLTVPHLDRIPRAFDAMHR